MSTQAGFGDILAEIGRGQGPFKELAAHIVTTSPDVTVTTRAIAAADLLLVRALADGLPLAEAAERAQAADPAFDLQGALALHLTGGTFTACR